MRDWELKDIAKTNKTLASTARGNRGNSLKFKSRPVMPTDVKKRRVIFLIFFYFFNISFGGSLLFNKINRILFFITHIILLKEKCMKELLRYVSTTKESYPTHNQIEGCEPITPNNGLKR